MDLDPRQIDFLKHYLDTKSKTFSNALQSALKAGYKQEYAENLTHLMPKWLSESLGNRNYDNILKKAERNIETLLDSKKENIKLDVTKFTTSRLGKKKWSDRTELTGDSGQPIKIELAKEVQEKYDFDKSSENNSKG